MSLVAHGAAFRVDGPVSEGGNDREVTVTGLTNGNFVVAWMQDEASSAGRIFWRLFDENGVGLTDEQKIDAIGDPDSFNGIGLFHPSIAATANGGFAIGYQDAGTGPSPGYEYWVTSFDADGDLVSGPSGNVPGMTEFSGEISLTDPAVKAVSVNGTFNGSSATHLFVNGADTGIVCATSEPSIAAFDGGGYVVSWVQFAAGGDEIWAMYSHGGVTSSPFVVNTLHDGYQQFSAATRTVATLSNGGFVITWRNNSTADEATDSGTGVSARVFGQDGQPLGDEFVVPSSTDGDQQAGSVVSLSGGGFVVCWQGSQGVSAQRYDNQGQRVGGEHHFSAPDPTILRTFNLAERADGQLVLAWSTTDGETYAQFIDVSNLITGNNQAQTLTGTVGSDYVQGLGEDDLLKGRAGDDSLLAGVGADTLMGGAGADSLDGGAGRDTASYRGDLAVGVNLVTGVNSGDALGDVFTSIERFVLSDFADSFTGGAAADYVLGLNGEDQLSGGGERDTLYGGAGADTLAGGDQKDRLFGDSGADLIEGGSANDTLVGGSENDTLVGGEGRDKLNGETGADMFRYLAAAESGRGVLADVIDGFSQADGDQIDLSAVDAGILAYIGSAGFSGEGAHEVRVVNNAKGQTVYVDTDGDGAANMQITVLGGGITDGGAFVL